MWRGRPSATRARGSRTPQRVVPRESLSRLGGGGVGRSRLRKPRQQVSLVPTHCPASLGAIPASACGLWPLLVANGWSATRPDGPDSARGQARPRVALQRETPVPGQQHVTVNKINSSGTRSGGKRKCDICDLRESLTRPRLILREIDYRGHYYQNKFVRPLEFSFTLEHQKDVGRAAGQRGEKVSLALATAGCER